jgi:hypothetical protein
MATVKAGSKDLRALARELRFGLVLESDGKSKVRIVDTQTGLPLRYDDGRVVGMPNSPCGKTVKQVRRRLESVGALKSKGGR